MRTDEFEYDLPPDRIAQTPVEPRDSSRLMVVERASGSIAHRRFRDLPEYLRPGDALVLNDSRVIPARLFAHKASGGRVELLLLRYLGGERWEVLVGGKRVRRGALLRVDDGDIGLTARVEDDLGEARRVIAFDAPLRPLLDRLGHTPLPPYIHTPLADGERYQTVYSQVDGSAAAPTAGLHFTPELLLALRDGGVVLVHTTLHIGLDTFKPVTAERIEDHVIHSEWASLSPDAARTLNQVRLSGGRIVTVGTTAVRTLETAALRALGVDGSLQHATREPTSACPWQTVVACEGPTDLFIFPGFRFRAVDALVTNFHLPRSSLLMLVSAFAGRELMRRAYDAAIAGDYRFYSFGDAMLIL
jgi:S-adenosylmethionine:tRNA ribosyltransferase-isomerase